MRTKNLLLILCCVAAVNSTAFAQVDVELSAAYSSVNAEAWNKAVQAFNTSRPWLNEEQGVVSDGQGVRAALTIPFEPGYRVGAAWELVTGAAESAVFQSGINREIGLTFNTFTALLEVQPFVLADSAAAAGDPLMSPWEHLSVQVGFGFNFTSGKISYDGSTEDINGEPSDISSEGIGLLVGAAYAIPITDNVFVTLNSRLTWMPSIDLAGFPEAIHNTPLVGLQSESTVLLITSGAGIKLRL